ncbi:MAG: hypothetical protein EBV45_08875, partial [Chloroflexi bacterium]|nr:hypothetical protein [Chloroflexota bacterium]
TFPGERAVRRARAFVRQAFPADRAAATLVEVEVDSLDQLAAVLPAAPDIVLLDNMSLADLARGVAIRDGHGLGEAGRQRRVILEASGGINLTTVRAAAEAGVTLISVGALTHSAPAIDVGLDFDFVIA